MKRFQIHTIETALGNLAGTPVEDRFKAQVWADA